MFAHKAQTFLECIKGSDDVVQHSESLELRAVSTARNSKCKKTQHFGKPGLFLSSGEERETLNLLGPLGRDNFKLWILPTGPNRVGISLPSPEEGNRPGFRNVVLSCI
jgi:hypothetical protein